MGSIQGSSMIVERSEKPGRFSFFPKGALTHHLVVAKSVFLRFCLAAKTADTSLLLLSPQSRLCGAPFGGGISFGNRALCEADAAPAGALWTMPQSCELAVIVHAAGGRCYHL